MSPVEASGRGHVGRAGLVSIVAVAIVFGGLWLVSVTLGDRNSPDLNLGSQTFRAASNAEKMAGQIADNGPIIYTDVSGRKDRDLILQHLGTDPTKGWYAFAAQPADRSRDCTWSWKPDESQFRATCDDALTAPKDGKGLVQYKVSVKDNAVIVDLNYDERTEYEKDKASTTTTTAA
jgi:hypothetical protein